MVGSNTAGTSTNFANNATLWLLIWTANNVGVTLLNKAAFSTVNFRYPFFLSAIHMAVCIAGCNAVFYLLDKARMKRSKGTTHPTTPPSANSEENQPDADLSPVEQILGSNINRTPLDKTGQRLLLIFSVIFSLNIAIGNVSLKYVSVNFNQVMRSLVPAITIAMGMCLGKPASRRRIIAVIPIVVGVAMACFGDMSYTAWGFFTTVACIVLAALKVVASGELLTGKVSLHPVDLLARMAPLALVQCMALALLNGEIASMIDRWYDDLPFGLFTNPAAYYPTFVVFLSGMFSFTLNICSLQANKLTSPLTLCIAANVKQVVMIAVSTIVFGTEISPLNGMGIIVVLAGSARYSYISLLEKKDPSVVKLSIPNKQTLIHYNKSDIYTADDPNPEDNERNSLLDNHNHNNNNNNNNNDSLRRQNSRDEEMISLIHMSNRQSSDNKV